MTSYETISADITNLFDTIDRYVNMFETNTWLNSVTTEDLKTSFKLAKFIEDSVLNLESKQCANTFFTVLNMWWKRKSRTQVYNRDFYSKACDHLLAKFFQKNIPLQSFDNAIRMYTSIFSQERFENVIGNLILMSASYTRIIDYTVANKDKIDIRTLECRLLLTNWLHECECGRMGNVQGIISTMFLSYKIQSTLPILITILTINVNNEELVTSIILDNLYVKMDDRSVLSKQFWLSMFKCVNKLCLSQVCCMMNYVLDNCEMKWMGDPKTSICPNLTYNDLVELVKFLFNHHSDLGKYIELRIVEAKKGLNVKLWDELMCDI
ncbi:hypothetical protein RI129_007839 [Pyrocoelia pectoralis]|uniref:Uncharacterized protein n=1 Tax=Pyrocoelia pectoralis TaxID=417401 RepID=A0AAN7VH67_9COLE